MDALFCFQNANAPSDHSSLVSVMPWLTELVVVTIIPGLSRQSMVDRSNSRIPLKTLNHDESLSLWNPQYCRYRS